MRGFRFKIDKGKNSNSSSRVVALPERLTHARAFPCISNARTTNVDNLPSLPCLRLPSPN